MKKNFLYLFLLVCSITFGQSFSNFNNTSSDGLWSNALNWSAGLPTQGAQLNQNVNLDVNVTLTAAVRSSANTLTGTGKITSAGGSGTGENVALLCTGANFNFNGNMEINNTAAVIKTLQVNNTAAVAPAITPSRQLTLGASSVLTLSTTARVTTQVPAFSKVVFRGVINGSASLQLNGTAEFDASSNNSDFNGDFVFAANSINVVANNTGVGTFLKAGRKVQVNNPSCSLTLNGANSCKGNLSVAGTNSFALNINANQEDFGSVVITDGPLTINVASTVTNLSFANSAASTWGTGTIAITGFQSGEIRFGNSSDALTPQQLSQITADGVATGKTLVLDANGYLVLADQFVTYDNAASTGDGKWSTVTNWIGGSLPTLSAQLNTNIDLDTNQTLPGTVRSSSSIVTGAGKLTLTGGSTDSIALLSTGSNFNFNGIIELNSPTSTTKALQVNNAGTTNRQLTLGAASVLTLTTPARVSTQLPLLSKVVFRGTINGSANLQFAGTAEFDASSNNSDFNGDFVFAANSINVVANNTGVGTFLKAGRKVQVNNPSCSLTLNGANSCKGNLSVAGTNSFALNINANQEDFGSVVITDGPLTINVASTVTNLSFANSAASTWGTGTIAITGFQSGEIRFGNSSDALTPQQLSQITADGVATGEALTLDSNGYLVVASSLVPPTISSLTNDGTTLITEACGGSTLIINGTNFTGATAVTVNSVDVSSFVVINSTTISAILPANATTGVVTVTTASGSISSSGNFTVNQQTTTGSETVSSCGSSYTWPLNGQTYNTPGTYTHVVGCNTATLTLTLSPNTTTGSVTTSICGGTTYVWSVNSIEYSSNTTQVVSNGCNTATLNLTITEPTTEGSVTTSICSGASYTWPANGQTYTTAQNGITFVSGCNTATLNLTITEPTTTGSETISQCGGSYTWPVNNVTYTASTTEVVTEGCNTATLNLTITPATTTGSETISQCGGSYTWPVNNVTYSASTTEVVTEGCNTATLNLTITPATTTGSVTTSINAGESYTWPANGQTYTTAQNGTTFVSGCNTATLNLTVITTQIPTSPYAVCTGATVATATAGTTLKFYKDTKTTTAAYAGTQKLAAATYYVTEMVSGTESARVPVEVTLTALVAPTTIASTEAKVICKYMGTSNLVTFTTTPVVGASSYSWSVPAGATIEGNATGESITVSFEGVSGTPGLIGSVTVDSKNSLGCLSGKAKILALTTKAPTAPKTVVLTNGATVIKKAGNFVGDATKELTLTATDISGTADHHVWTLPAGTTVVSGDANNDLVLTVHLGNVAASNDALVFSCASVGGCGSSSKILSIARAEAGTPKAITLTDALSATPTVGIKKLDAYTGSLKTRTLTLTATPNVTAGSEATSYKWVLPAAATVVDGTATAVEGQENTYTSESNVISVNLASVATETSFVFKVYGVNGNGTSLLSKDLTCTSAAPKAPTAIFSGGTGSGTAFAYNPSCGTVTISVPAVLGVVNDFISVSGGAILTNVSGNTATIDLSATSAVAKSTITIRAIASTATGSSSKDFVIKLGTPCGAGKMISEELVAEDFTVIAYPNPSASEFTIESSSKGATTVQVYDMMGRLIENAQANANTVQVGRNYAAGTYNVIVSQGAKAKTLKVIKK